MADAKLVSSPLVTEDGGAALTVPPSTTEGTTAALTATSGESVSIEESEETPEARALAQGPYNYPTSFFCYHWPRLILLIVEFYFADTNLPYDKSVSVHSLPRVQRRLIIFKQIYVDTSHR